MKPYTLLIILIMLTLPSFMDAQWQSSLVHYDAGNKLVYATDQGNNRIPDFSYAGYRNGESEIPVIPVIAVIYPVPGDNTAYIQTILDSLGNAGSKGAILLSPGNYQIWGTLKLRFNGIVLRGSGDGSDSLTNTILVGKGDNPTQRTIIIAGGGTSTLWKDQVTGTKTNISSDSVLVGSNDFYVDNASQYSPGDNIIIYHTCSLTWLQAINYGGTHSAGPGEDTSWAVDSHPIVYNRYIKAINGNKITIDAPVYNHLIKSLSQSYIYKYARMGIKTGIGIENLRIDIETLGGEDENHAWQAVDLYQLEDSWVRNCTSLHFGQSGIRINTGSRITIDNCKALDPVSTITGERRYNFNTYSGSQQILFKNCLATNGRHHYVSNGTSWNSGVVFLNCTSSGAYVSSEGHRQWSQGYLYDNHKELDGPRPGVSPVLLALYNRGDYGTAHGWAIANSVAWNCDVAAGDLIVQKPPTAQNYAIGCKGARITGISPPAPFNELQGYIEGSNTPGLSPQSLYLAQLQERLSISSVHDKGQIPDKTIKIFPNYPNPFNPETNISFSLPSPQFVTLKVYDLLGNEIKTILNEYKNAGQYSSKFNGSAFPSGIYFYKLVAGSFTATGKMIILK
ncbi:MAG: T9SS type A sorting domain-containing protein [Ignavibacteriaceae bacterium]|nr:T9SS type A sorting domain-containing protein [Ignavibacteriaceae bacterium]